MGMQMLFCIPAMYGKLRSAKAEDGARVIGGSSIGGRCDRDGLVKLAQVNDGIKIGCRSRRGRALVRTGVNDKIQLQFRPMHIKLRLIDPDINRRLE